MWHLAKNVSKKLREKAKTKKCSVLIPWLKSISNHLWWSAATCNGDPDILKEKWTSIVHHIVNEHQWTGSTHFSHMLKFSPADEHKKKWLRRGSHAHEALKDDVLNKRLLKDIGKLNLFCHTGGLEVYHSVMTKERALPLQRDASTYTSGST